MSVNGAGRGGGDSQSEHIFHLFGHFFFFRLALPHTVRRKKAGRALCFRVAVPLQRDSANVMKVLNWEILGVDDGGEKIIIDY